MTHQIWVKMEDHLAISKQSLLLKVSGRKVLKSIFISSPFCSDNAQY